MAPRNGRPWNVWSASPEPEPDPRGRDGREDPCFVRLSSGDAALEPPACKPEPVDSQEQSCEAHHKALTVLDHCRALVLGFLETEDTAGKARSLSVMTGLREPA